MRSTLAEIAIIFQYFAKSIQFNVTAIHANAGVHEDNLFIMKLEILK